MHGLANDETVMKVARILAMLLRMTAASKGSADDRVDLICVTTEHIEAGKRVPDGQGTLTVSGRLWAYCTAGLVNAPHNWEKTGGVPFDSIRHAELPVRPSSS